MTPFKTYMLYEYTRTKSKSIIWGLPGSLKTMNNILIDFGGLNYGMQ